jgi:hypothetical protein
MSNNTVTGIIQDIIERPLSNSKLAYDIFIIGDERQFGAGFKRPNASVGDTVTFSFFVNGAGYNNIINQVRVTAKASASVSGMGVPAQSTPASNTAATEGQEGTLQGVPATTIAGQVANVAEGPSLASGTAPAHRQQAWGFAANRAIDFLTLAHTIGALKVGKNKTDNLDAIKALLDSYTEMFYNEALQAKVTKITDSGTFSE